MKDLEFLRLMREDASEHYDSLYVRTALLRLGLDVCNALLDAFNDDGTVGLFALDADSAEFVIDCVRFAVSRVVSDQIANGDGVITGTEENP